MLAGSRRGLTGGPCGPDKARDSPAMLGEWGDAWANQAHGSPPIDETAHARGEDVLDPVDVPSVGEGDDEAVSTRERGDRSSVEASADAAPVEDHAEVGKTRSHWPKHGIAHPAIETSQPSGKRHRPNRTAAPDARIGARCQRGQQRRGAPHGNQTDGRDPGLRVRSEIALPRACTPPAYPPPLPRPTAASLSLAPLGTSRNLLTSNKLWCPARPGRPSGTVATLSGRIGVSGELRRGGSGSRAGSSGGSNQEGGG